MPTKAVLAKALRCVAHAHGCHLIYTASTPQKAHELMQKKLRSLLTHMMFSGFERKLCAILFIASGFTHILVAWFVNTPVFKPRISSYASGFQLFGRLLADH
jgi:hypothetical protein